MRLILFDADGYIPQVHNCFPRPFGSRFVLEISIDWILEKQSGAYSINYIIPPGGLSNTE